MKLFISLQPLLEKDGLLIPYIALTLLLLVIFLNVCDSLAITACNTKAGKIKALIFQASCLGSLTLFLSSQIVVPPKRLPDLYPVLFAVWSCGHFVAFLLYFNYLQLLVPNVRCDGMKSNEFDITSPEQKVKKIV